MIPADLALEFRSTAQVFREHADELESRAEATDESIPQPTQQPPDFEWTWREKLWITPAETRIGTTELAEAMGRPKSWVYAHTQAEAENPIPHRKLDGALVFTIGEVRAWVRESEEVLVAGPMESTRSEIRDVMLV